MAKKPVAKKAATKPAAKAATKKTTAAKKPAAKKPAAKKAPARAAAAAKTPDTITLRQMAAELADAHGMTKVKTEAVLNDLVDMTQKRLKKGQRVRLTGLGTMEVRKRSARMGRNPATGESIKIKASKNVGFRMSKDLKEKI